MTKVLAPRQSNHKQMDQKPLFHLNKPGLFLSDFGDVSFESRPVDLDEQIADEEGAQKHESNTSINLKDNPSRLTMLLGLED